MFPGHVCEERVEAKRVIKLYDAATCPGSSGGLVMTPTLLQLQWPGAVHSRYHLGKEVTSIEFLYFKVLRLNV